MAPWPERGVPPRLAESASLQNQHLAPRHALTVRTTGRYRSASRVSELDVWDNMQNHQIQVESSSSDEGLHPRSHSQPSRPPHRRSMSHPFPSLFSLRKKKSGPVSGAETSSGDEGPSNPEKAPPMRGHHRSGSSVGSRDWNTGRCMTCGSLVRWPKELHVFKCTICVTINDLQPRDQISRQKDASEELLAAEEQSWSNDKHVSLDHTKALIEQCLRTFLTSTLKREATGPLIVDTDVPSRPSPSHLSPELPWTPAQSAANPLNPLALRPRITPNSEPRQHRRRAPSWAGSTTTGSYFSSSPERRPGRAEAYPHGLGIRPNQPPPSPGADAKKMFKPLEDYVDACFTSFHRINSSFLIPRSHHHTRHGADERPRRPSAHAHPRREPQSSSYPLPDLDPKLLLLGDEDVHGQSIVSSRSPHIDWAELEDWYTTTIEAGRPWLHVYRSLVAEEPALAVSPAAMQNIESQILIGQENVQKTLVKACESILKRPGRRITEPQELRFLLIITANPLLHSSYQSYAGEYPHPKSALSTPSGLSPRGSGPVSGRHSAIIKRIVGLMSNAPIECHNHLAAWYARFPEPLFVQTKDLFSGFLAYRLVRQNEKRIDAPIDYLTGGLIPRMGAGQSSASLHAALGHPTRSGNKKQQEKKVAYQEDWQIRAVARVLGFLFTANNMSHARHSLGHRADSFSDRQRQLVRAPGQILATSDFYMTLLDDSDLVADFEAWERRQDRLSFCQYPFLLSIGAKIRILEHEARRQMEDKARDAFFDSILTNRTVQKFLVLNIRRDCLVDDSLKAVSEVIGSGGEEIKKMLKIIFKGEEGIDAGGLRKEWFLLLVRELFNPDHGMFLYDEDSQYCYFNPNSLEPSEQFFLVGVVLGLAIYNSTILDVALPPFAFRKLLLAAPPASIPTSQPRQSMTYTLDDLAEYRPRLAHGLRQLLDFEGDVESTFGLDFAIDTDRYGVIEKVPLCPNGERRTVTNANRKEYVDSYVRYLLDTAVTRQFEPFKRGFFTVCNSNALSLFRPEEIELLVRGAGSDQPLDVASLKAVAQYDNWRVPNPAEDEPTVRWFWETLEAAEPPDQRRLLAFITGSDRIPAMGAASLGIRVSCLGEDCGRFPTARTCFNSLGLWRCSGRERFEEVLWRAVRESEGFGLK
ncbi:hypothetical protein C8A03DRAFT_41495 [Achaetomium macrosporum]|uniref:HECT-type E3 ubiquitin transferase n=1 Tax=Achaetomium macrosporum TaxID=79813 RepID=A0AAN7HHU4_9PEZI|nr:hypothetical protein C8A03DRAFT_41495 [Achaetomium macrosporum]